MTMEHSFSSTNTLLRSSPRRRFNQRRRRRWWTIFLAEVWANPLPLGKSNQIITGQRAIETNHPSGSARPSAFGELELPTLWKFQRGVTHNLLSGVRGGRQWDLLSSYSAPGTKGTQSFRVMRRQVTVLPLAPALDSASVSQRRLAVSNRQRRLLHPVQETLTG